jgi:cellulose synthase/poly-beta-1,6-N-acetylglucosamine synthase-like glycosyltransferase
VKTIFWLSVLVIGYVYAGYPLLLAAWAFLRPRPVRRQIPDDPPPVSLIIAARNEGARLAAKLENLASLDYPRDRLQVIVVSDGSTDETHDVLERARAWVEAVEVPAGGKSAAVNAGVQRARHEILVFADARQAFAPDAVRHLVANFTDPDVGGVSGELVLDCEHADTGPGAAAQDLSPAGSSSIGEGVGLYWRYEKWLRRHESAVGSTLGATGAIYAMRRSLWRSLPPETLLDDVLAPMRAVLARRRIVFEPNARAFDRVAPDAATESRRKSRTLAGNYQLLWLEPRLLLPFVNPMWFQFVSHKLGRLVVPYALVLSFVSSAILARHGAVYTIAFAAQMGFYLLAAYGAVLARRSERVRRSGHVTAPAAVTAPPAVPERGEKGVVNA